MDEFLLSARDGSLLWVVAHLAPVEETFIQNYIVHYKAAQQETVSII